MGEGRFPRHVVALQTGQLPVLRDWYLKVLDAHVVYENDFLSFLTFDDEHHRVGIAQLPFPVDRTPMTVGLAHTAYTFGSLRDLLATYEELKEAGIQPHVPVQHGPTTSIYYRDPDGNTVELQIDNFATADEATEYLRGDEFRTDPVGPGLRPRGHAGRVAIRNPRVRVDHQSVGEDLPPPECPRADADLTGLSS